MNGSTVKVLAYLTVLLGLSSAPYPFTTATEAGAFRIPSGKVVEYPESVFDTDCDDGCRSSPQRVIDPNMTDRVRARFRRGRGDGAYFI